LLFLAVGVALKEALSPEFKVYQKQVVDNAKALCMALQSKGFTVVSGILPHSSFHIHILFECMQGDYLFFHYSSVYSFKCELLLR